MKGSLKENWWTPPQEALVEDRSRLWQLKHFQPSDALVLPGENGARMLQKNTGETNESNARIVRQGWDHEHCALCWRKISEYQGDEKAAYTDGRDWLCVACYEKFVVPRLSNPA